MRLFTFTLCLLIFAACTSHKTVTIASEGVALSYDCARFEPQAKSQEETFALMYKSIESMRRSREEDNIVLFHSLRAARELKDIRRLEELIVSDECAHLK